MRPGLIALLLSLVVAPAGAQEADPLAPAAELVRAGNTTAALERLSQLAAPIRATAGARYLRGRLLERLGRLAEAAESYDGVAGLDSEVQADMVWRRARALARSDQCNEASALLESIEGRHADEARALAAECAWREASDQDARDDAIAKLRRVVADDARNVDSFAAAIHLVDALLASGRRDDAARELRELYISRPNHPDAGLAEQRLNGLDPEIELSVDERMERAENLLEGRHVAEAAALLEGNPPRARAQRSRWLHLRGMALYKTRLHYAEAARVLAQAARAGGPTAIDDEFHAARALSRADQDDAAVRAYRRLVRRHARHPRASQAEYLAAWLELYHGRARGERAMQAFADGPRATPARKRNALWHLGLRAFERRRFNTAAQLFARYADLSDGPMDEGRGRYWAARARHVQGRRADARRLYRIAREAAPLHWYGIWADMRLRELGVTEPPPLTAPDPGSAPPELTLPAAAAFYHRLGLRADALESLRRRERALRRDIGSRGHEVLTQTYLTLGEAHRAYQIGNLYQRLLKQTPTGSAQWAWDAAYPRPFEADVRRAAQANQIEPALVYAIMRQESGFNQDAVSHADAIGLLQLLPSSAERLARRMGARSSRDRLFDPAWNIRLGAAEIKTVLGAMNGCLPLAIASYNAGIGRVRRWIEAWGELDLDLLVEKIPFDETRNYVRRVTSHYARYSYLAAPDSPIVLPIRVEE